MAPTRPRIAGRASPPTSPGAALPPIEHGFTHFRLTLKPLPCAVRRWPRRAEEPGLLWLPLADAGGAALPAPIKKLLRSRAATHLRASSLRACALAQIGGKQGVGALLVARAKRGELLRREVAPAFGPEAADQRDPVVDRARLGSLVFRRCACPARAWRAPPARSTAAASLRAGERTRGRAVTRVARASCRRRRCGGRGARC